MVNVLTNTSRDHGGAAQSCLACDPHGQHLSSHSM